MIRNLILVIGIFSLLACQSTAKQSVHDQFRGLWKLYIIEAKDSTGIWQEFHWNKGGDSYILYDGLGHMSVQITPKDYRKKVIFQRNNAKN